MKRIHYFFLALLLCLQVPFVVAQDSDDPFTAAAEENAAPGAFGGLLGKKDGPEVTAELLSDAESIAPGAAFTVAVKFDHKKGWVSYWKNTGSIQAAPKFEWTLPAGFKAGDTRLPTPEILKEGGGIVYGYHDTYYVVLQVTAPADLPANGESVVKLELDYQFCQNDQCKFEMGKELSLKLPHAAALKRHPQHGPDLEKFLATKFPKPMDGWTAVAFQTPKNWLLSVTPPAGTALPEKVHFLSEAKSVVDAQKAHVLTNDEGKWFISAPKHEDLDPATAPKSLSGLLMIGEGAAAQTIEMKADVSAEAAPKFDGDGREPLGLLLWFAFVGGLILNLMPCVFPVIGIKIMDFVKQSGEERWKVKVHGLIFSLGILITFWILSAIFMFLRSRGEGVGWGFQLQNPWVVYALMLVMFIFALNMYGVFEIGASAVGVGQNLAGKKGFVGSFFKGALAVVVSTPCSAPFLATALSAVISLPAAQMFLVFTFIALGLAAPYLILTASPALLKLLPKPGAWMEAFKQIMSFLMFGTAGYLLWIYGGLVADSNMLYAILGLTAVGMALYIHGKWNTLVNERSTRIKAVVAVIILAAGGIYLGYPKIDPLKWEPWTKAREEELLAEGKPVYIDFTARWCATCQTNKVSYKSREVIDAVKSKGIVLLKADWTDHNDAIRKEIEGYDRSAIPVNVLLIPGAKEPEILPNILTSGIVLEYFNKVPAP